MRFVDQLLNDRAALAVLAAELRIVALPGSSPRPESARLWYRAREPYYELFIDVQKGGIHWWQLTLRGYAWTWSRTTGRVTCETTTETEITDRGISASALLGRVPPRDRRRALLFCAELLSQRDEPFIHRCGSIARDALAAIDAPPIELRPGP